MDPVQCTTVADTGQNLCWVSFGAGKVAFPMIDHYYDWTLNGLCKTCTENYNNSLAIELCNDIDLLYYLYFDGDNVRSHHYLVTAGYFGSNTSENAIADWSNNKNGSLCAVFIISVYGYIYRLNEFQYISGNNHCTDKILRYSSTRTLKNLAKPPTKLQESYFQCKYSANSCVSESIAAASGIINLVSVGFMVLFATPLAFFLFGIPTGGKVAHLRINELEDELLKLKGSLQYTENPISRNRNSFSLEIESNQDIADPIRKTGIRV